MKKFALLALMSLAGMSQAVLIDGFGTGAQGFSIQSGSFVSVANGAMLGGQRDVQGSVLANPANQFLDVNIGGGFSIVSNGFLLDSVVKLQYDRVDGETPGAGQSLLNSGTGVPLGLDGDRVRINFLGNDLPVTVVGILRLNGSQLQIAANNKLAGGPGALDIAFNPANLAAADSLTLEFQSAPSGDYALGSIETVPEPASLIAIGAGLAGVLARRRRK